MRRILFLLIFLSYHHLNGQELLSCAGENGQNSSGSLTFAIGEIITETGSEGNQLLTQGYCQPPPETANLSDLAFTKLTISPNPFSNYVIVNGDLPVQPIRFSLCSIDGQEVFISEELDALPCQLIFPQLSEGSYLLYVHASNDIKMAVSHLIHIAP